ncbi:COG4315 family predicted lipoprotein [Nakamurella lactea]|uniref:COG4315 family predicted lipoprotein n=1 Tax=Nakamurella lactea TaxID=459515 RepID=UPI000410B475|nr:hypothetical protein [Nakamurella lactea]
MTTRILARMVAVAALGGLALAGCAGNTPASTSPSTSAAAASTAAASAAATGSAAGGSASGSAGADGSAAAGSGPVLGVADSSLGQIVVDGKKMTVYVYDKDTQNSGKSSCSGACATAWPAVNTDSMSPTVDGVTGQVGTITGVDGKTQVTLNGWPLYYYANDAKAGDVTGQGVGGVWWAVAADGSKVTAAAAGGGGY